MAHGGGKEDESAALWLPAPAATRPPPAADPREGPRGRHPAAGRARASPKHQGVRWAQRSAFSPLGPGLREETSCASGPGRAQADPRAAGASSGDGGGAARGPELGGGTSCGRGGDGEGRGCLENCSQQGGRALWDAPGAGWAAGGAEKLALTPKPHAESRPCTLACRLFSPLPRLSQKEEEP